MKVLIADDSIIARMILRSILGRYDVEILEAEHGQIAFDLWKKHAPDIVLADMIMPYMSGHDLIRLIKREKPQTLCILITAHEDIIEEMKSDYMMSKPIIPDQLHEVISKHLTFKT